MAKSGSKRDKAEGIGSLALTGAAIGSTLPPFGTAIGGAIGALTGLIVLDTGAVLPMDVIAVPAHEWSAVRTGQSPSVQFLIKSGETVLPTGPNVIPRQTKKQPVPKYQRTWSREYRRLKARYPKRGHKVLMREAHRATKRALK